MTSGTRPATKTSTSSDRVTNCCSSTSRRRPYSRRSATTRLRPSTGEHGSGQVRTGQVRSGQLGREGVLSQVVRYRIRTGRCVLRLARSFLRIGICRLGGWRVTPMKGRPAGVGAFSSDVLRVRGKVIAYGWIWSVGIRLRDLLAVNAGEAYK